MKFDPRKLGALCDLCPRKNSPPVPTEGPRTGARVVWLGQDPGQQEVKQNRPFVGSTGARLLHIWERGFAEVGVPVIPRNEILITNSALCQPLVQTSDKEGREAMTCCRPRLVMELETRARKDAGILIMGKWAYASLTGMFKGAGKYQGFHTFIEIEKEPDWWKEGIEKLRRSKLPKKSKKK